MASSIFGSVMDPVSVDQERDPVDARIEEEGQRAEAGPYTWDAVVQNPSRESAGTDTTKRGHLEAR